MKSRQCNRLAELVRVSSQWVTFLGERWLCDRGTELEYWRVEQPDSVIVLPLQSGRVFCISPVFRPGVGRATHDFPGGRLPEGMAPHDFVPCLLERELGVSSTAIERVRALNTRKWNVNSSFSNQGLWGFVAEIADNFQIPEASVGINVGIDPAGIERLMADMDCLQCRMVLLEWLRQAQENL